MRSSIDPTFTVVLTCDPKLSPVFDHFGLAFCHLEKRMIYINSSKFDELGLNTDHLLAIEAHEIAHHRLGHDGGLVINEEDEIAADNLAIEILLNEGHVRSADLLRARIETVE